jgi:hypothetical protein
LCEEVPRQKAAESRKIPESGSVIPREGVESFTVKHLKVSALIPFNLVLIKHPVIPREGVESPREAPSDDPERGS